MPELPEVETVRRTLLQLIKGKEIKQVEVLWPKMIKRPEQVEQFNDALVGQTVKGIDRRGKFLKFLFDDYVLVSHLRMEGRYIVSSVEEPYDKHTHVFITFTDGTQLRYRDVRKFGTMHLYLHEEVNKDTPLTQLGPEPFSEEFTIKHLMNGLKKTNRKIKVVLLDQKVVVGLGNIYVDEALYRARIHPERAANSLSQKEFKDLHKEIIDTLSEAVEKGGSTIRSYVNTQGQMGMFQLDHFVYGRKGEACKKCGREIEKFVVGGRGTHICPKCQKMK